MLEKKEFDKLSSYIRMYVERVIGLKYPVLDSPQPKTLISDNPIIYLPMSFESLCEFLGKEFVESADRAIIFAIVIGLAYHETAHLVSGEKIAKPHILNNLICDSNDFNVVPQKWNGSIPYTLTLVNATYRQGLNVEELDVTTKEDKLQGLIHLSITFLRKLRVKFKGQDVRALPKDHPLYEAFERIKPILKDARKAKVERRPLLVKKLYKVLKEYWTKEEKKESQSPSNPSGNGSSGLSESENNSNGNGKNNSNNGSRSGNPFDQALDGLSSEVKVELRAIDAAQLKEIIQNNKLLDKIKRGLQDVINQARIEEALREKRALQQALANIGKCDKDQNYQTKELRQLSTNPVHVNERIVNSLRKNLRLLLFERAVARRRASVEGIKFSPGHFYEIKTNPENPRIRQDIKKIGKNLVETELILCFDRSGSMGGDKEKVTQEIAGTLYKALSSISKVRIDLLGFDDITILIANGKKLSADIVLRKIPIGLAARGGTNFPRGLRESIRMLENSPAHKKIIFMLTDGDTHGTLKVDELLMMAKNLSIEVFCIGVEGSDKTEIERIFGKKNSLYVNNISKLPEEIKNITLQRL